MAPLGSSCSEEIEQEDFGNAPDTNCMICRRSYEESPEMVIITIMTQTYCKICIREKLVQSEQAHDQFIRGVPTGQRRNNENNTVILETSSTVTSLPRGYVYPNSKRMKMAVEERPSANKKVPYSSLRMNPENSGIRKRKRAMR